MRVEESESRVLRREWAVTVRSAPAEADRPFRWQGSSGESAYDALFCPSGQPALRDSVRPRGRTDSTNVVRGLQQNAARLSALGPSSMPVCGCAPLAGRRRWLRRAHRVVILTLAAWAVSGACSPSQNNEPRVLPFTGTTPTVTALSRGAIEELKRQLSRADGRPPSLPITASVFPLGSDVPDEDSEEWKTVIRTAMAVRAAALENGWQVLVEGFTDSSGPPSINGPLSDRRAAVTQAALIQAGYPEDRVVRAGRGVAGPSPADRKVVVSFVRRP